MHCGLDQGDLGPIKSILEKKIGKIPKNLLVVINQVKIGVNLRFKQNSIKVFALNGIESEEKKPNAISPLQLFDFCNYARGPAVI